MKIERIFPCILILESFIASIIYFWKGDLNLGFYWIFAGLITASITFKL